MYPLHPHQFFKFYSRQNGGVSLTEGIVNFQQSIIHAVLITDSLLSMFWISFAEQIPSRDNGFFITTNKMCVCVCVAGGGGCSNLS